MPDDKTSKKDANAANVVDAIVNPIANTNEPNVGEPGPTTKDAAQPVGSQIPPAPTPDSQVVPTSKPGPQSAPEQVVKQHDHGTYPPISPELRRAAEDVRILYSYISREGRLEPEKLLEQPLSAYAEIPDRVLDSSQPPSYEERATLWKILSELSKLARPASADAIRSSYYAELMDAANGKGRKSNRVVERPIRMMGIIGFVITLVLGLYVSFTESVVGDTVARINEYNSMRVGSYSGTRLEKLVVAPISTQSAQSPSGNQQASDQQPSNQLSGADAPTSAARTAEISDFKDLRDEALDQVDREITDSFGILEGTTFQFGREIERIGSPEGEHSLFEKTLLNRQGYINKTISSFILPAVASLLGAIVFILRDAQRRMESVSLSPLRSETYGPRLILAIIAGTVIGWLTGQDSSGVFGKISPAAASFVVGYCTEILYRLLDSIKQALGVDEEEAARQKTAPPSR
ncbi:hypothetical protein ACU8KI_16145 [Rhizobium leguminosarum]